MGIYGKGKDNWAAYAKDAAKAKIPFHLFKPKKGESLQDVYKRANKFYKYRELR